MERYKLTDEKNIQIYTWITVVLLFVAGMLIPYILIRELYLTNLTRQLFLGLGYWGWVAWILVGGFVSKVPEIILCGLIGVIVLVIGFNFRQILIMSFGSGMIVSLAASLILFGV
nr:hypothetical protein [Candidatus Freyarchaeota archaeon]